MGWLLIILLLLAILVLSTFDIHSFRMIHAIKRKDYAKAIRIAEGIPQERRSVAVVINHIGAFYFSGQQDKARELFAVADKRQDYKRGVRSDLEVWRKALYPESGQ